MLYLEQIIYSHQAPNGAFFCFTGLPMRKWFVFALLATLLGVQVASAGEDRCTPFDAWVGAERYDYHVDKFGQWNFPPDATLSDKVLFPHSSLWRYYSISQDTAYVVVFLDTDVNVGDDDRAGLMHVCVYAIVGGGVGKKAPGKKPMDKTNL